MQFTQPQKRVCEECQNSITLNLFPLNSKKCRYCLNGEDIPKRLLDKANSENGDPLNSEPIEEPRLVMEKDAYKDLEYEMPEDIEQGQSSDV